MTSAPSPPVWPAWPVWSLACVALLVIGLAVAGHHGPLDREVQHAINAGAAPWRWLIELLGQLGLGATLWLIVGAILARQSQAWAALSLALVVCGVATQLLKYLLLLPRPLAVLEPDALQVFGEALHGRALPSGHTASAFALLGAMVGLRWRPWLLAVTAVLAGGIAWSRVATGAHWPSDVLAGAALGLACGFACAGSRLTQRLTHWAERPESNHVRAGLALLVMASLLAEAFRLSQVNVGLVLGLLAGLVVLRHGVAPRPRNRRDVR